MEKRVVDVPYASGGAGFAISRALMVRLNHTVGQCIDRPEQGNWAGDLRVGKCLYDLGARVLHEAGFHHEPSVRYPDVSRDVPVVSFHHLSVDEMHHYHRMTVVEDAGADAQLYRWDFSDLFLREYASAYRANTRSLHIRFGESITIAHEGVWRQAYTDPLYLRHAVENQEDVFYMQIAKVPHYTKGDGCAERITDARLLPRRKSALLRVQCRPCAGHGGTSDARPEFGVICDVVQQNRCVLRVELAVPCPRPVPVFAVNLDVGTSSGARDVVFMGRPRRGHLQMLPQRTRQFYVSLTHGTLAFEDTILDIAPARCRAWRAEPRYGSLRANEPLLLDIRCSCCAGAQLANVTVVLALKGVSSPTWTYVQQCTSASEEREHE
tara:strand:- start:48 stop:1190 length:1143 start_codon:yes stop_codon:yes gene_type:complete